MLSVSSINVGPCPCCQGTGPPCSPASSPPHPGLHQNANPFLQTLCIPGAFTPTISGSPSYYSWESRGWGGCREVNSDPTISRGLRQGPGARVWSPRSSRLLRKEPRNSAGQELQWLLSGSESPAPVLPPSLNGCPQGSPFPSLSLSFLFLTLQGRGAEMDPMLCEAPSASVGSFPCRGPQHCVHRVGLQLKAVAKKVGIYSSFSPPSISSPSPTPALSLGASNQ